MCFTGGDPPREESSQAAAGPTRCSPEARVHALPHALPLPSPGQRECGSQDALPDGDRPGEGDVAEYSRGKGGARDQQQNQPALHGGLAPPACLPGSASQALPRGQELRTRLRTFTRPSLGMKLLLRKPYEFRSGLPPA